MKKEIIGIDMLYSEYTRIMEQEVKYNPECKIFQGNPYFVYTITKQVGGLARDSRSDHCRDNCYDIAHDIIHALNHPRFARKGTIEFWTIDFFAKADRRNYKDCGFYTALIVMSTLIANGRWYDWREKDYLS